MVLAVILAMVGAARRVVRQLLEPKMLRAEVALRLQLALRSDGDEPDDSLLPPCGVAAA